MSVAANVSVVWFADVQPGDSEGGLMRFGFATGADTAGGNREVNYVITVAADTPIFREIGKNCTSTSIDDLEAGPLVQVRVAGPIAESYPMRARVGQIIINSGSDNGSRQ